MNNRLFLASIIAVVIALAATGCGALRDKNISRSALRVALVFDPVTVADDLYNKQLEEALFKVEKNHPDKMRAQVLLVPGSGVDRKAYIREQIKKNDFDLIIDTDMYYTRSAVELAGEFPKMNFIIMDENIAETGKDSNIMVVKYSPFQVGFVAGYAAAAAAEKSVSIICLKGNPNSRELVSGFKKGISYSEKKLNILVQEIDLPEYDIYSVLINGQKLRNNLYSCVQRVVRDKSEVVIVDSMLPVDAVLSALKGSKVKVVATEAVPPEQQQNANFLCCVSDNYARGLEITLTKIFAEGFSGGRVRLDFSNDGINVVATDKRVLGECISLVRKMSDNSKEFLELENEK